MEALLLENVELLITPTPLAAAHWRAQAWQATARPAKLLIQPIRKPIVVRIERQQETTTDNCEVTRSHVVALHVEQVWKCEWLYPGSAPVGKNDSRMIGRDSKSND